MSFRSVVLALLSIALIMSGIGLAAVQQAVPAIILGSFGFVLALGWFGSVLLGGEQDTSQSLNQRLHDLSLKRGERQEQKL